MVVFAFLDCSSSSASMSRCCSILSLAAAAASLDGSTPLVCLRFFPAALSAARLMEFLDPNFFSEPAATEAEAKAAAAAAAAVGAAWIFFLDPTAAARMGERRPDMLLREGEKIGGEKEGKVRMQEEEIEKQKYTRGWRRRTRCEAWCPTVSFVGWTSETRIRKPILVQQGDTGEVWRSCVERGRKGDEKAGMQETSLEQA